ncbi:hypothetical protein [Deinococcus rufus]|uniref:Uncharacterized protein n=1 Tax=Deinococcus rufus TaxID=2136097 RepID=A0ABV7ZA20_9DEIO
MDGVPEPERSVLALRPVRDASRIARLSQIAQGPWLLQYQPILLPGDDVTLLRAGGVTGYRGHVTPGTWGLPDTPRDTLAGHPAFQTAWPGQRGVVAASAVQHRAGTWHDTPSGEVLLLAAVWTHHERDVTVSLVVQDGLAQTVAPARLWHWLHWPQDDALAALP